MTLLRAQGLVRRFGDFEVVRGASLALEPAEAVALVGPSGCGKTTLLQMIGLLDRPDGGSVSIDDTDAWSLSPTQRADLRLTRIGFVFQQHNLLPHLNARENVALPAWRLCGSRGRAFRAADELLESFALSSRREAPARVLSAGEAQRVAIARALVNRPSVVLCDEPTGSLDSASAASVLAALDQVAARGAALLIVTHDAAVASRARRVLTMRDGQVGP